MSYADILRNRGISASGADNESWSEASRPVQRPTNERSGTIDLGRIFFGDTTTPTAGNNNYPVGTIVQDEGGSHVFDGVLNFKDSFMNFIDSLALNPDNVENIDQETYSKLKDRYDNKQKNIAERNNAIEERNAQYESQLKNINQDKESGFAKGEEIKNNQNSPDDSSDSFGGFAGTSADYDGDLSHAQIYDEFAYEMPDYGYASLPELLGSGDARAAYDYMRFANNRYGRYGDLADYFNYDESDENAAQAAFDSYVSGYFNPTRNELSVSDLADVNDDAARILGSYAGDRDAFMNYFMDNFASNYALANADGDYQLGYDELGNPIIYSATGMPYLTSDMDGYEDTLRDMWTTNILRSAYNSQLSGDSSLSDSQIEQLLGYYTNDNIQDTIDFGKLGNNIPDSDMLYSAAGLDTYTPEMVNLLGGTNLGDLALYYNNPNFVPMYSQALASQMGVGSNLDSYSDAELEAFAQMVGLADISDEDQKKEK